MLLAFLILGAATPKISLPLPEPTQHPPLPLQEQLLHSTVRLSMRVTGDESATGTAFFARLCSEDSTTPRVLVTNGHVIADATEVTFVLTEHDGQGAPLYGRYFPIKVPGGGKAFLLHPDYPRVDLAVLRVEPLIDEAKRNGRRPFVASLGPSFMGRRLPSQIQIRALEDVIMIGYPDGVWDEANNLPIVRKGLTATDPRRDYEGRSEFLVDVASFEGSSGSPVVLYDSPPVVSGDVRVSGVRAALLGVLFGTKQFRSTGKLEIVNVPTRATPKMVADIPMNLGFAVKAERIFDFEKAICAAK